MQVFYPTGIPVADTLFSGIQADLRFQVAFEYPFTNALTGIPENRPLYTFSGANFVKYDSGTWDGAIGYIISDILDHGQWVPAFSKFGLWTCVEGPSSVANLIPYQRNSSSFIQRYGGAITSTGSQIANYGGASDIASTATSVTGFNSAQTGSSTYFAPCMLLVETDSRSQCVGVIGDSLAYGVGEGVAGSSTSGDALGDANNNSGFISRGLYAAGLNYINLGRGSDRLEYLATAANWKYRRQLLQLAKPTHIIQENGVNDLTQTTMPGNWAATTAYAKYQTVIAGGARVYMCTQAGTSGSSVPTGTGFGIVDGTAVWVYLRAYIADAARAMYRFAYLSNLVDQIRAAVPEARVYGSLITPNATSTDAFATTVNQTPASGWGGSATRRGYFNDQLRTDPNSVLRLAGLIDPNVYLEDGYPTETSKWVVNGSANYATLDGTHPNSVAAALAAAAISSDQF
jgi:lysophospholipase L1-like esterase